MDTTPVLTAGQKSFTKDFSSLDDSPFVDRVADKVRTLAAVKLALVRLLEWQIDQELERSEGRVNPLLRGS